MITFIISLVVLFLGYLLYGRLVERVFGPDDRVTPAIAKRDDVDFVPLPNWKVYMIQFLNIAGTGPIFGAIMGAKFGPAAYLWIVFGTIFAGAVHDYLSGMVSMRNGGASLPELIGNHLGKWTKSIALVLTLLTLLVGGTVFVYSPAAILHMIGGDTMMWVFIIFAYYVVATMLPIDKIIGKIYPVFAVALIFMAVALAAVLFVKMPHLPELWTHFYNMGTKADPAHWTDHIFPALFITVACGAVSGFHATQSPLMGRCMKTERLGRRVFYGAMVTEGLVALIWATIGMWFFYASPTPGYELLEGSDGFYTAAPAVVHLVSRDWLGAFGAVLALLGVVAAPITSGDTTFRSSRLILADWLKIDQKPVRKRLYICLPLFAVSIAMLVWQIANPDGFNTLWQYMGFFNQTLATFTLWTLSVYLVQERKCYWIALVPALFMTAVCSTYLFVSRLTFGLPDAIGYPLGGLCVVVATVWFAVWHRKMR
jgi:carbon starvation protein CstA